ncbi:molybdenum cofactor guanylyltransferase [Kingella negevensis]|uniref:molybdenum cofactor guanylyltransferase n=1 Tax=Kingella negevensis TaxID=1522312 RepID=UPI0009E058F8|nr:molybdenum cofactor guanylyltransferase [Kingella negevensis]
MKNPLLILCGGRSSRMGSPKQLLQYAGQTLISRQTANALPHRPVWLAADNARYPDTDGAIYLPDQLPDKQGALSAISPALELAKQQGFSGLYVLSCDTLLLPENVIVRLNSLQNTDIFAQGITALQDGEQLLPLLAHWSVAVSGSLKNAVDSGNKRVQFFVKSQPFQTVPMPENWSALCNFNTPEEFERAVQAA